MEKRKEVKLGIHDFFSFFWAELEEGRKGTVDGHRTKIELYDFWLVRPEFVTSGTNTPAVPQTAIGRR